MDTVQVFAGDNQQKMESIPAKEHVFAFIRSSSDISMDMVPQ